MRDISLSDTQSSTAGGCKGMGHRMPTLTPPRARRRPGCARHPGRRRWDEVVGQWP
ncbi:hypothetical protein MICRO80W_50020 [Micrococcus luteus]|nr:hypothetical protein MICRO80W_50020 [Micrococcus luteus]